MVQSKLKVSLDNFGIFLSQNKRNYKRAEDVRPVMGHLPGMCEAPALIPSFEKIKTEKGEEPLWSLSQQGHSTESFEQSRG